MKKAADLARSLRAKLRIPVMAGPMFIASTAELVIAQCNAGIIGSMPALNPRSTAALHKDIARIRENVGDAPYCINLVAHKTNERLRADLDVILHHKVPIVVLDACCQSRSRQGTQGQRFARVSGRVLSD